jgi:hypothetical protein
MARLESVAVGGYYPTPPHLVSRIADLVAKVRMPVPVMHTSGTYTYVEDSSKGEISFMDPCAGEGAALLALIRRLYGPDEEIRATADQIRVFTCEMEKTRADVLKKSLESITYAIAKDTLVGDAFRAMFERTANKTGVGLLYLNPPYDTDPVHGRLEQRFLERFTRALTMGGVLLFVVPFYALKASAETLAQEYRDVRCFRFPGTDFDIYRQVVLIASKREPLLVPDPQVLAQVQEWAADASTLPELPPEGSEPLYSIPIAKRHYGGLNEWEIRPVDLTGILAKVRPWSYSTRTGVTLPIPGVLPDVPVQELMLRTYPLAVPPRPAHIAAGIASGLFNGARIDADEGVLPALLVKGVFDREYKTIEEKQNKDGEITTVIQVQQPKLVVTVLDLETHKYHVLSSGTEATGSKDVASMNVADLLAHYGDSLMDVMKRQCPVLYDPRRDGDSITLASSPRKLFTAQTHVTKALVKIFGGANAPKRVRRGRSAILLGEIGSGKSTVSLMAARTVGAHRPLIMCPPHLLEGWKEQISAVVPDAEVHVLADVEDLERVAKIKGDRTVICIMSREAAKLSHSWEGAAGSCPKCGAPTLGEADTLAKKRVRCSHRRLIAKDLVAREARELAVKLLPFEPSGTVGSILHGRFDARRAKHYAESGVKRTFKGLGLGTLDRVIDNITDRVLKSDDELGLSAAVQRAIVFSLLAAGSDAKIVEVASKLFTGHMESFSRQILHLLGPDGEAAVETFNTANPSRGGYDYTFSTFQREQGDLRALKEVKIYDSDIKYQWTDRGVVTVNGYGRYSLHAAVRALETLAHVGQFGWSRECGEELFGASPEPRRVALAKHIVRYHRDLFDFLILDEGHEYATDGSAQERSAHRLTTLGLPTILMTGTIMNGYAESLFMNMWALSADFRSEFGREERQRFVDRYGYRKRAVQEKDLEGKVVEFGSNSDRVTIRSERIIGSAPGVLPLFLLRHLLPIAVTLHKADLAIDLPACTQHRHEVEPSRELLSRFEALKTKLVTQIRADQFSTDGKAGKLFGQLAELPSYLDRATSDVGNVESGDFEIRYPETVDEGKLIVSQPGFSSDTLLPKEEWMLDLIERKLEQGRNVMVFSWHVALLPRLARLIEKRTGEKAPILYADKVATGKRQDWINREILKKGRRILVTNPVAIQTGLNNLVHFSAEIWMENPGCNAITFRQAIGRVDRIGQTRDTEIHVPVYKGTLQVALYDLLMKKVAVSVSTDGLDPESALQAAGLGEDEYLAGLSIGKQLWSMIGGMGEVVPLDSRRRKASPTAKVGT